MLECVGSVRTQAYTAIKKKVKIASGLCGGGREKRDEETEWK